MSASSSVPPVYVIDFFVNTEARLFGLLGGGELEQADTEKVVRVIDQQMPALRPGEASVKRGGTVLTVTFNSSQITKSQIQSVVRWVEKAVERPVMDYSISYKTQSQAGNTGDIRGVGPSRS